MSVVVEETDFTKPVIRRKTLSAVSAASLATNVDFAELGEVTFDEPSAEGGSDLRSPERQGVRGALCAFEAVTFELTAREIGFCYAGIRFDAPFTIDVRGSQGMRDALPPCGVEARVAPYGIDAQLTSDVKKTQTHCPTYNLFKDAGISIDKVGIRCAPGQL